MTGPKNSSSPKPIIDSLMRGVYGPFALLAGMQLDVFTPLAGGPLTVAQLADALGVAPDRLGPLVHAIAATGLLRADAAGLLTNSDEASTYLVRGRPLYCGSVHELTSELWHAAMQTADSVRTNTARAKHDWANTPDEQLAAFFRGLHAESKATARELSTKFDFSNVTRLVDVGGGSGGLAIEMVERWPKMRATIAELPRVAPHTERFVAESAAKDRITVEAHDVAASPLAGTYDVAVLRAFVQVLGREDARRAIHNVARAVRSGGAIYIVGMGIIDDARTTPLAPVMFNLVFINLYDAGQAYTESEHRAWLSEAGFEDFERTTRGDGGGIIRARKF